MTQIDIIVVALIALYVVLYVFILIPVSDKLFNRSHKCVAFGHKFKGPFGYGPSHIIKDYPNCARCNVPNPEFKRPGPPPAGATMTMKTVKKRAGSGGTFRIYK